MNLANYKLSTMGKDTHSELRISEAGLFSYKVEKESIEDEYDEKIIIHMTIGGQGFIPEIKPKKHQITAVQTILKNVKNASLHEPSANFVQHATGSGKSFVQVAIASFLSSEPDFIVVFLLADRTQLCHQLGKNCENFLSAHGTSNKLVRINNCIEFVSALVDANRGFARGYIFLVSVQVLWEARKCDFSNLMPWNGRVGIIGDEVHRSQGKGTLLLTTLRTIFQRSFEVDNGWLPKPIIFIGFTATPTESALRMYGDVKIVDHEIVYTPLQSYTLSEAQSKGDVCEMLKNYECTSTTTRKQTAEMVLNHYLTVSKQVSHIPKAMVVEANRTNVLKMAKALQEAIKRRYPQDPYIYPVRVFFSGLMKKRAQESYNKDTLEEDSLEKAIFYVVCDKLRTGYNNHDLSILYINRKFDLKRSHEITQTIGRVCRVSSTKKQAFILDFVHKRSDVEIAVGMYMETTGYKQKTSENILQHIYAAMKRAADITNDESTPKQSMADLTKEWQYWCNIRDRFSLWKNTALCNLISMLNPLEHIEFEFETSADLHDYEESENYHLLSEYPDSVVLKALDFPSASPGKYGWPKPGMPSPRYANSRLKEENPSYWYWYVTLMKSKVHPLAAITSTSQYRSDPKLNNDRSQELPIARIGKKSLKFASKPSLLSDLNDVSERQDISIKTASGGVLHIPIQQRVWFDLSQEYAKFAKHAFEVSGVAPFPVMTASRWRACCCKQNDNFSDCKCLHSGGLLDLTEAMICTSNSKLLMYCQIVVVTPDQVEAYKRCKPYFTIFQLPHISTPTGIGFARFWMEELARELLPQERPFYFSLDDSVCAWQQVQPYDKKNKQRVVSDCSLADVLLWLSEPFFAQTSLDKIAVIGFHRYHPGFTYPKVMYSRRHVSSAVLRNLGDVSLRLNGHGLYNPKLFLWEDLDSNYRISGGNDPGGYPPMNGFRNQGGLVCKSYKFCMIKQPLPGGCGSLVARMTKDTMAWLSNNMLKTEESDRKQELLCAICSKSTRKRTWKKKEEMTTVLKHQCKDAYTYIQNGVQCYVFCQKCRLRFLDTQTNCTVCNEVALSGGWKTRDEIEREVGISNLTNPSLLNEDSRFPICQKCLKNKFGNKICSICSSYTHVNAWKTEEELKARNITIKKDATPIQKMSKSMHPICQSCRMNYFLDTKKCAICQTNCKSYVLKTVESLINNTNFQIDPFAEMVKRQNVFVYFCCQACKSKYNLT